MAEVWRNSVKECGAEVQLLVDGGFDAGRRHASREPALRASTIIGKRLERSGWVNPSNRQLPESVQRAAPHPQSTNATPVASHTCRHARHPRL